MAPLVRKWAMMAGERRRWREERQGEDDKTWLHDLCELLKGHRPRF